MGSPVDIAVASWKLQTTLAITVAIIKRTEVTGAMFVLVLWSKLVIRMVILNDATTYKSRIYKLGSTSIMRSELDANIILYVHMRERPCAIQNHYFAPKI